MSLIPIRPLLIALFILALPAPSPARETLAVDPGQVIQENFLGVNAVHHGFSYLPESLEMGMTAELRTLELARVKESGIRIARTFYRPDWAMGDGPWLRPDWDSPRMRALYAWLADLQGIGVDVALNMGWWFPRDVIWNREQHIPTYPDDLKAYCRWLSESIHQIVEKRGFTNVKYLVMFTEPAGDFGDAPGDKKVWEYYAEVLRAANQRLLDDGRRQLVKIVGPNTAQAPMWLDLAAAELDGVIDIYASHHYNFTTYQEWHDLALSVKAMVAKTGKPFWIDEYGVQDFALRQSGRYGTVLALANAAFLNAGVQSSFLWILNDQYYPAPLQHYSSSDSFLDGKHSWGLFPWLPESRATRPGWDAFVLLARLLEEGAKVVKTEGLTDLPIAALTLKDGGTTVLVVNGGQETREVEVRFSREVLLPLYCYRYRPEERPLLVSGPLPLPQAGERGLAFPDTLHPGEVVIYSTRPPGPDGLVSHADSHEAEGSDNLALRQAVEATSTDPDWPAAQVTDGKRLTAWRSAGRKKRSEEVVTIDLGRPMEVRLIEVLQGDAGETTGAGSERQELRIEHSVDKERWQQVRLRDRRPDAKTALFAALPPQPARYVRVRSQGARRPCPDGLFRVGLGEVKVFGVK